MRYLTLVAALLAAAPAAADEYPIPYDAAKAKKLREARLKWVRETTLDRYLAVGKRNPKWDDPATRGLKAIVDVVAGSPWGRADAQPVAVDLLGKARKAGCDDPLVRYYHVRFLSKPTGPDTKAEFLAAARELAASRYPDVRKAHAWLNAIAELQFAPKGEKPDEDDLKTAADCLDKLLTVLAALARDKDPRVRPELIELCDLVARNGADIGRRQDWFDRLDAEVLKKVPETDPLRPLATGLFLTGFAWDARGDGPGNSVGPDAARAFRERLEWAEKELTRAWELDKDNSRAAAALVNVCTGLGRDRETMETWFRRALEADPDEPHAFIPKMRYLHPNWHGTKEDVLAFGRQAAKSDNWEGKVPILLPKAHDEIAALTPSFEGYFRDQPAVWKEIEPVLAGLRKRYPKSRLGASWYLFYAWVSEKNAAQAWAYVQAAGGEAINNPFTRRAEVDAALKWAKAGAERKK